MRQTKNPVIFMLIWFGCVSYVTCIIIITSKLYIWVTGVLNTNDKCFFFGKIINYCVVMCVCVCVEIVQMLMWPFVIISDINGRRINRQWWLILVEIPPLTVFFHSLIRERLNCEWNGFSFVCHAVLSENFSVNFVCLKTNDPF